MTPVKPALRTALGTARRVALLVACIGGGAVVGGGVRWLSGSNAGFLAIPAFVILAWLFVADPTACEPRDDRPRP